jgi:REP-associated tyrosine transposase
VSEIYQSLSHSRWNCKYHVVFVPKRRRRVLFGQAGRQLGEILHALARRKECQIVEGHLMPDHVHGKGRNFTGEHFWARGYAVSTVGFELEQVRQYIREQEDADGTAGRF